MGKSKEFTEEESNQIIYNYTVLKRGVNAIGKDFNVAGKTIQNHLKKKGIKIRNLAAAMQESRAANVNDNYFKTQSHNMAYILGLLASDGCISKDTNHWNIDLQEQDEEILKQIQTEIGYDGKIEHYTNNLNKQFSRLRICSRQMKSDLQHYGITPHKTFTLKPPEFLDPQYYISYIRGYFDGDGCFYFNEDKNKYNWYICGARREVIQWIHDIFINVYGIDTTIQTSNYTLKNGDHFYYLQTYSISTISQIFEVLYISDSLYMQRKFNSFKNFYDIKSTRLYSLSDKEKRYAELI